MSTVLVSLRIPTPLLERLKSLVDKGEYLDLSELVRSILRQRWTHSQNPQLHELRRLRQEIADSMKERSVRMVQQQLIDELEQIKKQIQEGRQ